MSKLNRPITVLSAFQVNQRQALFSIRILENSQIALLATTSRSSTEVKPEDPLVEEVICPAPDALIPHHQWVHFAVGCRKPKGSEHGEARIFVNGVRVGAMRVPYPVPIPLPATLLHKTTVPPEAIRLSVAKEWTRATDKAEQSVGKEEENEWFLGRALLLEEALPEDLVLLMHRLVRLGYCIVLIIGSEVYWKFTGTAWQIPHL